MEVKIKKLCENAVIPAYAKNGDAGMDIVSTGINENTKYIEYNTGLSFEVPDGYVGLLFARSSISNYDLVLANSVGVLDSGYRGEVKFRFKKTNDNAAAKYYEIGDKIGQIMIIPYPQVRFIESELSETERGIGGYGSTGV
jgi:dUTP pyrophosphatase